MVLAWCSCVIPVLEYRISVLYNLIEVNWSWSETKVAELTGGSEGEFAAV